MALTVPSLRAAVREELRAQRIPIWFPVGSVQALPDGLHRLGFSPDLLRCGERSGTDVPLTDELVGQTIEESRTTPRRWRGRVRRIERDDPCYVVVSVTAGARPAVGDGVQIFRPDYLRSLLEWADGLPEDTDLEEFVRAPTRRRARTRAPPAPGLGRTAQDLAVARSGAPFSVIWGPPGTGKTTTLAHAIAHRVRDGERVLATAPTRIAADGLTLAVDDAFARLGIERKRADVLRTDLPELYERFSLDRPHLLAWHELDQQHDAEVRRLRVEQRDAEQELARTAPGPRRDDLDARLVALRATYERLRERYKDQQEELVRSARVVVSTVRQTVARGWAGAFDRVVVDEAGMVSLADAVYVLTVGRCTVFAGDPRQLGPITQAGGRPRERRAENPDDDARFWLGRSLLDVLDLDPDADAPWCTLLDVQSRMNATLCDVVSRLWYGGRLRPVDEPEPGAPPLFADGIAVLDPANPPQWVEGERLPRRRPQPHTNQATAAVAIPATRALAAQGYTVAVMAPYRNQAALYRRALGDLAGRGVRAGTVHRLQGQEADVAIYDPTYALEWFPRRSPEAAHLTCVASSRARRCFVLAHEPQYLERNDLLKPFLDAIQDDDDG